MLADENSTAAAEPSPDSKPQEEDSFDVDIEIV